MEKHEIEFLKKSLEYCIQNQIKLEVNNDESENLRTNLLDKINELDDYFKINKNDGFYNTGAEIKSFDGVKAKILKVEEITYFIEDENGYSYYATGTQIKKRSKALKIA
jgi:hypothetical protein